MNTQERLQQYYAFDGNVLEAVAKTAADQNQSSFGELADQYGIADGPIVPAVESGHKAFEVLTITPNIDYDETQTRVYYPPMATPLDASITMRAIRLFGADPSKQLMLVGNPSALGQKNGKIPFRQMRQVWDGDLGPTTDPFLLYLHLSGIVSTEQIGYSYGADKAATASSRAAELDIDLSVTKAVLMEPAANEKRGLIRLLMDFASSGAQLDNYVKAPNSPPLLEARINSDVGLTRYVAGLLRMSNIAISNALADDRFEKRTHQALELQSDMIASIIWGTKSELASSDTMVGIVRRLVEEHSHERVKPLIIEDMHHAGGDDIDLHAAIVLQALA